jgi:hypothetical protein
MSSPQIIVTHFAEDDLASSRGNGGLGGLGGLGGDGLDLSCEVSVECDGADVTSTHDIPANDFPENVKRRYEIPKFQLQVCYVTT